MSGSRDPSEGSNVKALAAPGRSKDEIVDIVVRTLRVNEWQAREIVAIELGGTGDVVGEPDGPH